MFLKGLLHQKVNFYMYELEIKTMTTLGDSIPTRLQRLIPSKI